MSCNRCWVKDYKQIFTLHTTTWEDTQEPGLVLCQRSQPILTFPCSVHAHTYRARWLPNSLTQYRTNPVVKNNHLEMLTCISRLRCAHQCDLFQRLADIILTGSPLRALQRTCRLTLHNISVGDLQHEGHPPAIGSPLQADVQ